jgi:8-oxo-dGTP pyrophosphatase MutT (NUDIX family)
VLLVRATEGGQRVLLVYRSASLAFAGGSWVFPGGKLEPSDSSPQTLRPLRANHQATQWPKALAVAACRETFEETGIVLARRPDGQPCDPGVAVALQPHRAGVLKDSALFPALLADYGLVINPGDLLPWAHWITPSLLPKRFNTRFFLALMPSGQVPRCDWAEAKEFRWFPVDTSNDASLLATPTRYVLRDLAASLRRHGTLEQVMLKEESRLITPVMPKIVEMDGKACSILPWDPEYAAAPGEGVPLFDMP